MDDRIQAVLDAYHARLGDEAKRMRAGALTLGDRDQLLLAVGPDTGRLLNILVKSLRKPNVLELGTIRVPDPVAGKRYVQAVRAKPRMTSVTLPVGSGIEISRFEP